MPGRRPAGPPADLVARIQNRERRDRIRRRIGMGAALAAAAAIAAVLALVLPPVLQPGRAAQLRGRAHPDRRRRPGRGEHRADQRRLGHPDRDGLRLPPGAHRARTAATPRPSTPCGSSTAMARRARSPPGRPPPAARSASRPAPRWPSGHRDGGGPLATGVQVLLRTDLGAAEATACSSPPACTGLRMPANDTSPPAISRTARHDDRAVESVEIELAADDERDHGDHDESGDPRHGVVDGGGDARALGLDRARGWPRSGARP